MGALVLFGGLLQLCDLNIVFVDFVLQFLKMNSYSRLNVLLFKTLV